MPFEKGRAKTGGRKKGSGLILRARAACEAYGIDPFEFFAHAVAGQVICAVCGGTRKAKYLDADGKIEERKCASCHGDGKEHLNPRDRIAAAAHLANRLEPELKAMELSGSVDLVNVAQEIRAAREARKNKK